MISDNSSDAPFCITHASISTVPLGRPSMDGEILAFVPGFEKAFILKHVVEGKLCHGIPLFMFIDSKQMFDVHTHSRYPTDKRMMVDIAKLRKVYNNGRLPTLASSAQPLF